MNKETFRKLIKNKNNQILFIIIIIGVVFMLISGGDGKKEKIKETVVPDEETRLEEILSDIEGAGRVSVMITYYSTSEKDIAYETKTNTANRDVQTEESEDKKAVMTDGEPMVIKEIYPRAKGVIVTADGGGDAAVKQAISEAVTAVTEVPAHRIRIYKREKN